VRLLCIYQHAPTNGAPGIYRHRRLLSALAGRGWDVDLVSTPVNYMTGVVAAEYAGKPYVAETIDGIRHHWVWAPDRIHRSRGHRAANYLAFAMSSAVRASTLRRPDVIIASSPPLTVATVGALTAARFRRPWALEVRDLWPEAAASVGWLEESGALYRLVGRFARRHTSRADAVIVPNAGLVEGVRKHGARDVRVVTGAVLDERPTEDERRRARRELGLDDATCAVVYLGALGVANGVDLVLDAVRLLPASTPVQVFLVGDGSARSDLERRVGQEQLSTVTVVGPVPKQRVRDYLAAADLCLHVLRSDPLFEASLPTKVLEYFSAHRPFVTTVAGMPRTLALQSGGGYGGDARALAAELMRWSALSSAERADLGERAYAYGASRFGLEVTVDTLEALLHDLAARNMKRSVLRPRVDG
jgi:glycosyltransferase involved in cell wall biosynthesis